MKKDSVALAAANDCILHAVFCIIEPSMEELNQFIQSNPDSRELKRALAVQMVLQDYPYAAIRDVLQVSVGFISKWKQVFQEQGVTGLTLQHQGSKGYLNAEQRLAVVAWLKQKNEWNLSELQHHIQDTYSIVFASNQSYYDLFAEAGISWKKTQKRNSQRRTYRTVSKRIEKKQDSRAELKKHQ